MDLAQRLRIIEAPGRIGRVTSTTNRFAHLHRPLLALATSLALRNSQVPSRDAVARFTLHPAQPANAPRGVAADTLRIFAAGYVQGLPGPSVRTGIPALELGPVTPATGRRSAQCWVILEDHCRALIGCSDQQDQREPGEQLENLRAGAVACGGPLRGTLRNGQLARALPLCHIAPGQHRTRLRFRGTSPYSQTEGRGTNHRTDGGNRMRQKRRSQCTPTARSACSRR